jgi:propane monooxygenase reductase subunit
MAPILCLLRSLAERGLNRKATYYYGARRRQDLCFEKELPSPRGDAAGFPLRAALSESTDGDGWEGAGRLHHRRRAAGRGKLADADAYVCGPPPMVVAAIDLLTDRGVQRNASTTTRFTTTVKPIPLQQ